MYSEKFVKFPRSLSLFRLLPVFLFLACAGQSAAWALPATTTVTLTISTGGNIVTTGTAGSVFTLSAAVMSGGVSVTPGEVLFCDAAAPLCQPGTALATAQIVSGGIATVRLIPAAGVHTYKAVFLATATRYTSSTTQQLTVTAAKVTTTTATANGSAGVYSLTGTVASSGTSASPSGTVTFKDNTLNTTLGTGTLGSGSATFTLGTASQVATDPQGACQIVTADFNNDGIPDVALASACSSPFAVPTNGLIVLLGKGDGTFTAAATSGFAKTGLMTLAVGDFNNDGIPDLIVAGASSTYVLLGKGNGTFNAATTVSASCSSVQAFAVADFNQDGNADVAVACYGSSTLTLLLGNGSGGFTAGTATPSVGANPQTLVVGDFNNDGKPDLAIATDGTPTAILSVLLGNGDGTFTAKASPYTFTGYNYPSNVVAVGDVNGDGKADLIAVDTTAANTANILTFIGNGDGTFQPAVTTSTADLSYPFSLSVADFNGDGKTDVALVSYSTVRLLLSNGISSFTSAATGLGITSDADNFPSVVADFNGDGVPDIFASNSDFGYSVSLLTQRAVTATATLANAAITGNGSHTIVANYAGDTSFAASASPAIPLTGSTGATTLTLTTSATSAVVGQQVTLTAVLSPYVTTGNLSTNNEIITFYNNGTMLGTGLLSGGVATLNVTSLALGTDVITASYPGDGTFAASSSSSVNIVVTGVPQAALSSTSLTFAFQPITVTSAAQTVMLTNGGNGPLAITSIVPSGDFGESDTCGTSLAAGKACTISVTFTATAIGTRTGTITVTDNATGSPQTIALTGTAWSVSSTAASSTVSLSAGGTTTVGVQFSGNNGAAATLVLTCGVVFRGTGTASSLPTCSLNPAQVAIAGTTAATSTLSINTTAAHAEMLPGPNFGARATTFVAFLLLGLFVPRRRWRGAVLSVLGLLILGGAVGCNNNSTTVAPTGTAATTSGAYQVTVTGTSGSYMTSTAVTLTVQ